MCFHIARGLVVVVNENYLNTIEMFQHFKEESLKIPQEA
jgi:hypothetical protein